MHCGCDYGFFASALSFVHSCSYDFRQWHEPMRFGNTALPINCGCLFINGKDECEDADGPGDAHVGAA